jgi:hypothetical protein
MASRDLSWFEGFALFAPVLLWSPAKEKPIGGSWFIFSNSPL